MLQKNGRLNNSKSLATKSYALFLNFNIFLDSVEIIQARIQMRYLTENLDPFPPKIKPDQVNKSRIKFIKGRIYKMKKSKNNTFLTHCDVKSKRRNTSQKIRSRNSSSDSEEERNAMLKGT